MADFGRVAPQFWFRWHHGTVNDPKWKVVAARASHALSRKVTVGNVVAVWAVMLECASQSTPRGSTVGWVDEDVAAGLEMDEAEIRAIREAMDGKVLADGQLTAWKARQPLREDASAADRKRAQRERERETSATLITQRHAASRAVTREEKRGEEKEEQRASPKGSRLPDDWTLPADLRAWAEAERPDLDIDQQAARFADYWRGVAGARGRKADWPATWRNWVRQANAPRDGAGLRVDMAPLPRLQA